MALSNRNTCIRSYSIYLHNIALFSQIWPRTTLG
ncbi:uncharacterized protein METZ01_LOCUS198855, partial [marine metagenome]